MRILGGGMVRRPERGRSSVVVLLSRALGAPSLCRGEERKGGRDCWKASAALLGWNVQVSLAPTHYWFGDHLVEIKSMWNNA